MDEDNPLFAPIDKERLLSPEAHERIYHVQQRGFGLTLEAATTCQQRHLPELEANRIIDPANYKRAEIILSQLRQEYGAIEIPAEKFRECMQHDLDTICNFLRLSHDQEKQLAVLYCDPQHLILI